MNYGNYFSRIFATFRVVPYVLYRANVRFVCFVWLLLFPLIVCAEFSSDDSINLREIRTAVEQNEDNTATSQLRLDTIAENILLLNNLSNGFGYHTAAVTLRQDINKIINYMGYGSGGTLAGTLTSLVNQTNQIKTALGGDMYNTISDRLDEIINALESRSIPTDYATENTLSAFKDQNHTDITAFQNKYEEISAQFLTSWGFVGGSDGTYRDYLEKISKFVPYTLQDSYWTTGTTPYPNENHQWYGLYYPTKYSYLSFDSPFEALTWSISSSLQGLSEVVLYNMQKQSWNDWQAHTNLVSTISNYLSPSDLPSYKFDSNTNSVTLEDNSTGSSSSGEVIDTTLVSTNEVDTAVVSITNSTHKVETFWQKQQIIDRYISNDLLSAGQNYGNDNSGSSSSGSITFNGFIILNDSDMWADWRNIMSLDLLSTIREVMDKIWMFLGVLLCIYLVRKWGGAE